MPSKYSSLVVKPEGVAQCRDAIEALLFDGETPRLDRFELLARHQEWREFMDVHAVNRDLSLEDPQRYAKFEKDLFLDLATDSLKAPEARPLMNGLTAALRQTRIPTGFEPYYDVVHDQYHQTHSEPRGIDAALQHMPTEHVTRLLGHAPTPSFAAAVARRLTPPAPPAPAKPLVSNTSSEGQARSEEVLGAIDAAYADPKGFAKRIASNASRLWSERGASSDNPAPSPKGSAR